MCETVHYYDRWVNGNDLRLLDLAAGRKPSGIPPACLGDAACGESRDVTLELPPYEDREPALPALDARALTPVKHVLVHGSVATQDACPFSDVDIAVFVDDLAAYTREEHEAAVCELRRLLHAALAFDPLMHHGLMFAPAASLRRYNQRFLPVDTLARARVLHGPRTLQLRAVPVPADDFAQSARSAAVSLRKQVVARSFLHDDYRLKSFLSGALLMPARVLAAHGTCVYKRESFDLARSLFEAAPWEFITRCEALRALWKRPAAPLPQRFVPGATHPHLRQVIAQRMGPRLNVLRLSSAMIDSLVSGAHRFLDVVQAVV
ncbi:MAG TPA: nucleotidyltransferase domain-containing protein [Candidatus Baltobacteraceae bacterium]|nr:nucleotidyltransferase domain-containing protein [Candidatus Baltobacteraceae bacterium]